MNFNPWGYRDAGAMLNGLAAAIAEELKGDFGTDEVKKTARLALAAKVMSWVGGVAAKAHAYGEALERGVLSHAADWLSARPEDIEEAIRSTGARVVIFVDDVDRADPRALPDLLFMLKQVLDIGGLSFVVGLDPDVVSPALAEHHAGWHDGERFLEKIVDFARPLPSVDVQAILRVVEADRARYCSWLPPEALSANRDLMPRNPRRARAVIRHLWSLRPVVDRHRPDELDAALLVRVNLLRAAFPKLFDALFDGSTLSRIVGICVMEDRGRDSDAQKREVDQVVASARIADGDREYASTLATAVVQACLVSLVETVTYHATLDANSSILTWKEYDELARAPDVREWLGRHQQRTGFDRGALLAAASSRACAAYDRALSRAASVEQDAEIPKAVAAATVHLDRLRALLFECDGVVGQALLSPAHVRVLVAQLMGFMHFRNHPSYRAQRRLEHALLSRLFFETSLDPLELLAEFAPWEMFDGAWPTQLHRRVYEGIYRVLSCRAAEIVASDLAKPTLRLDVRKGDTASAVRHLVIRGDSPLWRGDPRIAVLAHLRARPVSSALALNAMEIVRQLSHAEHQRSGIPDREVVVAFWEAATADPINVRRFSDLKEVRARLESRLGSSFDTPWWWEQIEAEAKRSSGL